MAAKTPPAIVHLRASFHCAGRRREYKYRPSSSLKNITRLSFSPRLARTTLPDSTTLKHPMGTQPPPTRFLRPSRLIDEPLNTVFGRLPRLNIRHYLPLYRSRDSPTCSHATAAIRVAKGPLRAELNNSVYLLWTETTRRPSQRRQDSAQDDTAAGDSAL